MRYEISHVLIYLAHIRQITASFAHVLRTYPGRVHFTALAVLSVSLIMPVCAINTIFCRFFIQQHYIIININQINF